MSSSLTKKRAKGSVKATIISYNKEKQVGEAQTEKGEKIVVVPNSFEDQSEVVQLQPNVVIECEVFPQRPKGLYAYSAKVVTKQL